MIQPNTEEYYIQIVNIFVPSEMCGITVFVITLKNFALSPCLNKSACVERKFIVSLCSQKYDKMLSECWEEEQGIFVVNFTKISVST